MFFHANAVATNLSVERKEGKYNFAGTKWLRKPGRIKTDGKFFSYILEFFPFAGPDNAGKYSNTFLSSFTPD